MRKSYYFLGDINLENVQNLIDRLDSLEGEIDLFFETDGGYSDIMHYLIHYLNKRKDKIIIYLVGELCSSGTLILTDFKGEIKYSNLNCILFHKFDRMMMTLRKNSSVQNFKLVDIVEKENIEFSKKLKKLGLSKKELDKFNAGKDVVIYKDDFKRLNIG